MSRFSEALPERSVAFRTRIIDALLQIDHEGVWYLTEDICAGRCPLCGGVVSVYFAGAAARAEITCRGGCDDAEVVAVLAGPVRRASA
ncbi:MAG: hypothetical protein ACLQMH_18010 [Solirubrobacteraceae bacterium]